MNRETEQSRSGSVFRFREFPVYKDARNLRKQIKLLTKENFPKEEQYCLTSRLWRALDSILLNIAEGSERGSDIDFNRFLNIALTSVDEVVACLDAAFDDGYISQEVHQHYLQQCDNIYRQLRAFSAKVRKDNRKKIGRSSVHTSIRS